MTVNRMDFARSLGMALGADEPTREVLEVLRSILISEPAPWELDEQILVRRVAERLDATSDEDERFLVLTQDVQQLLETASSTAGVESLLGVLVERERFLGLIRKHADGIVSRTSFLSYVAEQQWPQAMRRRIVTLTAADLVSLISALESKDVPSLERILFA